MWLIWILLVNLRVGTSSVGYKTVDEGMEGLFELLDQLEEELSKDLRTPSSKIVGGDKAYEGQFPFVASLKIKNFDRYMHFCGGSAITTTHILTAAHCVDTFHIESLYVSVGDHDMEQTDRHEQVIEADKIIIHEEFNPINFDNDIAIIQLKIPFTLHSRRQTIERMKDRKKLQKLHDDHRTPNLTVLGWGTIREGGPLPQVLHFVKLPYIDTGVCRTALSPYKVFDEMFCAGDMAEGGRDACQGDSGGPIVYRKEFAREDPRTLLFHLGVKNADIFARPYQYEEEDTRIVDHGWELAGLVSWGIGCAHPGTAGINTNVAYYKEWIDDKINE